MTPWSTSVAKGLSSAYAPIGAVLLSGDAARVVEESGRFLHGFTYSGHPLAVAIAMKTLDIYERDDVPGHVRRLAPHFARRLDRLAGGSPIVGVTRSMGLFGAFDVLASPGTRAMFDEALQVGTMVRRFALEEGVIVRDIGCTIALCPPLVISEEEIDLLFDGLERALVRALDRLAREKALAA
jgi:4-aminobutyrate--pyruvate transaminase